MSALTIVQAPFTAEQVVTINKFQESGVAHPFTCGKRDQATHLWEHGDFGILRATEDGLVCDYCEYTQSWVYDFMMDPDTLDVLNQWPWSRDTGNPVG